jgi:hypothetical protein
MSFRIVLLLLMLFIPLANLKAQPNGLEKAFSLVELLSSEGMNVSRQVDLLNSALSLYRQGKMEEADGLVNIALSCRDQEYYDQHNCQGKRCYKNSLRSAHGSPSSKKSRLYKLFRTRNEKISLTEYEKLRKIY